MRQLDVSSNNSSVFGHNLVGFDVPMTPKNELHYSTLYYNIRTKLLKPVPNF